MASNAQISLKSSVGVPTAAGNQSDFLQQLQSALQGGTPVYDFFSSYHQPLQIFFDTIATGDDTIWLDGIDEKGNPVKYVQIGNNFFTIATSITNIDPIKNGTGTDYAPVGVATVTVTIDGFGAHVIAVHDVLYAGIGISVGIAAAVSALVRSVVQVYRIYVIDLSKAGSIWLTIHHNHPRRRKR